MEIYSRNRLYVSRDEQEAIKKIPIILAGSGIGSNIAECALRFGFENITVVDGDRVEASNLNRQNYIHHDISRYKAESLYHRLKSINPNADVRYKNDFISEDNLEEMLDGQKIAVNALDFTTGIPLKLDKLCQEKGIDVLHPYNLGWGGLVTVITPDSLGLESLTLTQNFNELKMVEYVSDYLRFWNSPCEWLEKIINDYKNEPELLPPPQLPVASWIVAGMCTDILFKIATRKSFKKFPEFYFNTLSD
ncbi:ThiF family adenylyltransferase [Chryseobacterium camelliae]|uniref:ThiF family adenylyltransferase n=1 Tax=Chryseobacterium camelliae TaxID=1265445 RepID=UPI000C1CBD9C|nr:ThiF family adenylyltransferase [Chryseobacterium camelliae]MDR6514782.1 molybdopterin/thiamine biosynthesis adenylyltransferase [Chryseobacterium camelliae]